MIGLLLVVYVVVRGSRSSNNLEGKNGSGGERRGEWIHYS